MTTSKLLRLFLITAGASAVLAINAPEAGAELWWKEIGHKCLRPNVGEVSAKLEGIPWGQSWEDTCSGKLAQKPPPMNKYGATGQPQRCEKDAPWNTGIWGKWTVSDDALCKPKLSWEGFAKAGCFGPDKQVYSARLMGSSNWQADCEATDTSTVAGKESWGKPDRCARDALNTGIWGEWYRDEEACAVPLNWGSFRDNGCVRDMDSPDANTGGLLFQGKRSYSAVLYGTGGDWLEACKFAAATVQGPGVKGSARFQHPTACVIADADRALSYVLSAVFGGAAALITSPVSPLAAAAAGAVIGVATTGVSEAILYGLDSSLNVWGVFWVDDETCGALQEYPAVDASGLVRLPTGQIVAATAPAAAAPAGYSRAETGEQCPATAQSLRGTGQTVACHCAAVQAASGQVWGSGPYTDDSQLCRAAVHAGVIPAGGGDVRFRLAGGLQSYTGSAQNGVNTESYGPWPGSIVFEAR